MTSYKPIFFLPLLLTWAACSSDGSTAGADDFTFAYPNGVQTAIKPAVVQFKVPVFVLNPNVLDANSLAPAGVTVSPLLSPELCVDILNGSAADATPVDAWTCNNYLPAQKLSFTNGQLRSSNNTCLDIVGTAATAGTAVVANTCSANLSRATQIWNYNNATLAIADTQLCLALDDMSGAPGTRLSLAPCILKDLRQQWGLADQDGNQLRGAIISQTSNATQCLDTSGPSSGGDGNMLLVSACTALPPQQWIFEGNSLRIGGGCLEATSDGTSMHTASCNGAAAQSWTYTSGHLQLLNQNLCIDVPPVTGSIQPYLSPCSAVAGQFWTMGGS